MADAMKPPLTEAVASRLYLVRSSLIEGREAAHDAMAFGRMRAVLLLDHAAELAVSTLLSVFGAAINEKDHLPALLDAKGERHAKGATSGVVDALRKRSGRIPTFVASVSSEAL